MLFDVWIEYGHTMYAGHCDMCHIHFSSPLRACTVVLVTTWLPLLYMSLQRFEDIRSIAAFTHSNTKSVNCKTVNL